MNARHALLASVLAFPEVGGCREREEVGAPARTPVQLLEVSIGQGSGGEELAPAAAREILAEAFAASQTLRPAGPGEAGLPAAFEVRVLSKVDPAVLMLFVAMPAPSGLEDELPRGLDTRVELERIAGPIALGRDLPLAAGRLVNVLDLEVALAMGAPDAIPKALASEDPEAILLALDWIQVRRISTASDAVVGLLDHADDRVALRAIECLGAIGSVQDTAALVRLSGLSDPLRAERVYEALGDLGGEDAVGVLGIAARNESDPDLASVAEAALARARFHGGRTPLVQQRGAEHPRGHRR